MEATSVLVGGPVGDALK